MSTQNALCLIQNLRPTSKFLLSRHTTPNPKNKASMLQMADVKTTKCCSLFNCVKITQNSCWHCFSQIYVKVLANTRLSDLRVPPSPTFCCMDQHKGWFIIPICSILEIIFPRCFSRYRQLYQITELQIKSPQQFQSAFKGIWYI